MNCQECEHIKEVPADQIHVLRKCSSCGREYRAANPGEHGIGFQVLKGDRFVVPEDWLRFSFNPLKSRGQLASAGVDWLANFIFVDGIQGQKESIIEILKAQETRYDYILDQSQLLKGLDIKEEEDGAKIWGLLMDNKESIEWWANLTGMLAKMAREAIEAGNTNEAVWAAMFSERCRMMTLFKEHLEEVVWMGISAKRLVDLLGIWDANRDNADEGFWQITLNQHTFALSQVFAVPLVFIKREAYVGGMNIDRRDAKFVDYLFATDSSRESVLIEIKTPKAKLLGRKYRGTYQPSNELSGAIMQVLDYRRTLIEEISSVNKGTEHNIKAFNPKCAIVVGNFEKELTKEEMVRAFDNIRSNSSMVEIITYDELFKKLEILANLFNLSRKSKKP